MSGTGFPSGSGLDERPDWVHCIGQTHVDRRGKSWCGRPDRPFFMDAGHAAMHGQNKGRLVACRECVEAICAALKNGHDDPEYQPSEVAQ